MAFPHYNLPSLPSLPSLSFFTLQLIIDAPVLFVYLLACLVTLPLPTLSLDCIPTDANPMRARAHLSPQTCHAHTAFYLITLLLLILTTQRQATTHANPIISRLALHLPHIQSSGLQLQLTTTEAVGQVALTSASFTPTSTTTTAKHASMTTTTTTAISSSPSPHTIASAVVSALPTTSKPLGTQPTTTPSSTIPRSCRLNCPANNAFGLTCFKNTQCVPVALLCSYTATAVNGTTTAMNHPCMDTTGPATAQDPITCQEQLCIANNFLPLPAPGTGKMNRNSSANCLKGSYFSLYGSSGTASTGGGMRYTQSCIASNSVPEQPSTVCKEWEYLAQNSCLLKTCGPNMDCEPPFICRKSKYAAPPALYGLCMNPNSTADPGGDDSTADNDSSKDHLLIGLLVGLCSLVVGTGVGAAFWHFRKTRMRQLALLNSEEDDRILREKTSFMATIRSCCCGIRSRARGTHGLGGTRDMRVVSVAESDGHESSLMADHRTNLIFARRWRWGAGVQHSEAGGRAGMTAGGVAIIPEMEPPPLYHQGHDLPSYRDRNTILLTPVPDLSSTTVVDPPEQEELATSPTPK